MPELNAAPQQIKAKRPTVAAPTIPIADIKIGKRHRRDLGNVGGFLCLAVIPPDRQGGP
jgi:hypothetical protein